MFPDMTTGVPYVIGVLTGRIVMKSDLIKFTLNRYTNLFEDENT